MLPPMLALRLAAALAAASLLAAVALASCGPNTEVDWQCIDPLTGKEDGNAPYDPNHYDADGTFDPCNCFDPCGPLPQCPILVDAGPPMAGCPDAGADAH